MPEEEEKLRAQVNDLLIRLIELQQYPQRMADQEAALRAIIAQRDAEIVELKQRLGGLPGTSSVVSDDLQEIHGIGPTIEGVLNGLGVKWFRQIARWTEQDVAFYASKLGHFHGRIDREGWIERARELHLRKYGEQL
jgi:predicted flap endonuclease-1-like 5' DNA nuclease